MAYKCDEKTWVGVSPYPWWPDRYDWGIHPLATHALRLKLRDVNWLKLHKSAYTEYQTQWDALDEAEQQHWLANAYENAANPERLEEDPYDDLDYGPDDDPA